MTDSEQKNIVGGLVDVSKAVIGSLSPQFMVLVLLNIAFLGLVLWFEMASSSQKIALMNRVMDMCIQVNPPPNLLHKGS